MFFTMKKNKKNFSNHLTNENYQFKPILTNKHCKTLFTN